MNEERAIYAGLVIVGLPVIAIAAVRGAPVGATETLAGLGALGGLIGLWRWPKFPKAWVRLRRRG
ncbi:MAG: hypothetical protein ABI678_22425 [Kofleriaceae bacterium]